MNRFYIRYLFSFLIWSLSVFCAVNHKLIIYLLLQAYGQACILYKAQHINNYISSQQLNAKQIRNLQVVTDLKRFSVDSLGFAPTNNFTKVYQNNQKPVLWVVTASEKYVLQPYEWWFPLIGHASYKGFFSEQRAIQLKNELICSGKDAAIRPVSAWSTLGWFNDPLMSNHLNMDKGAFCNLLFHELFHATFYGSDNVNQNENLANFIAHKATCSFLKNDTLALNSYLNNYTKRQLLNNFLKKESQQYRRFLDSVKTFSDREIYKQKAIIGILKRLEEAKINHKNIIQQTQQEIRTEQNAFFIDYMQYNSRQDSLEECFNKFYKGSIKLMVQSLRQL